MITITGEIDLLSGSSGTIQRIDSSGGNNVSNASVIKNTRNPMGKPFIIGHSTLGGGAKFSSSENYFIGEEISDENGKFVVVPSLTINGYITILNLVFDTINNIYPKKITIGSTVYENSNSIFTVSIDNNYYSRTIKFDEMNVGNTQLIVTGAYTGLLIELGIRNLRHISCEMFDRNDLKLPSFGIISNKGEIEFNDNDGTVLNYAQQNLLNDGAKCVIYLNNTLVDNAKQKIAELKTEEWQYDNDNRVVNVSLRDELQEWQDINVAAIEYDPRKSTTENTKPFSWLYIHLQSITVQNYKMYSFEDLDTETQEVLNNTYTKYPLLKTCSLWEAWTKLCEVCQLHIYTQRNGYITCKYMGGN